MIESARRCVTLHPGRIRSCCPTADQRKTCPPGGTPQPSGPPWSHRVPILRRDARFINSEGTMFFRICSPFALSLLIPLTATAESRCDQLLKAFGGQLADPICFVS